LKEIEKKKILKEIEKKREENIFYTLSFSHYHPHRHLSFFSSVGKTNTKIKKK